MVVVCPAAPQRAGHRRAPTVISPLVSSMDAAVNGVTRVHVRMGDSCVRGCDSDDVRANALRRSLRFISPYIAYSRFNMAT